MARDNGGIIGVTNNPTSSTATGVWSIESQYQARVGDTWPQRALFASNAVRYNSSSSDYLRQVEGTAATSGTTYTFSTWLKRSKLGTDQTIFYNYINGSNFAQIYFRGPQKDIRYFDRVSGGDTCVGTTSPRLFEDSTGWMNVVLSVDTTQSASADKVKFYINGEYLAFNFDNVPSTSQVLTLGSAGTRTIGGNDSGANNLDGYLSETILIDGQALDGTSFGTTNSDGVWVPIPYAGTYGNIGFNLQYGNAAALGTDSSPNANTFTPSNLTSIDQTTDWPENNYPTINNLIGSNLIGSTVLFTDGNLTVEDPNGSASGINPMYVPNIGLPPRGKWFCELKPNSFSTSSGHGIGLGRTNTGDMADMASSSNQIRYIYADTAIYITQYGSTVQSGLTAITAGQVVGMALDLDNGTLQYYVNGSTRASQLTSVSSANDGYTYFFFANSESSSSGRYGKYSFNFGNPPYAGGGYKDANGYGDFSYTVPSGFYAVNSANLAEFG